MRRRSAPPLAIVRLRAIFGIAFIVMGIVIGYQVVSLARTPDKAIIGLIFALALMGLGALRIRNYFLARGDANR